jgi:hypothetical protein
MSGWVIEDSILLYAALSAKAALHRVPVLIREPVLRAINEKSIVDNS